MTLTLDLAEDLASRVRVLADARGLPMEAFAAMALDAGVNTIEENAPASPRNTGNYVFAVERFRRLAADLAAGLPGNRIPLSDFGISRASFYEDETSRF